MIKMMMPHNIVSIFRHLSWSSAWAFFLVPSRLTRTIKPLILSPFRAHLAYLLFLSFLGYLVLISTNLRLAPPNARLPGLEAAFMSISAVTSSSMSTVEMELFTNAQLLVLTLLMFLGGEVFISMLALFLETRQETSAGGMTTPPDTSPSSLAELGINKSNDVDDYALTSPDSELTAVSFEKLTVVKALAYLVLAYILVIHFCGSLLVYLYMITVPTAAHVLKSKSILPGTFSLFLISSSFANCGFVPTNENMAVFKTDSVLLLLVVLQILMGNTLYPICIRILIRVMEFVTRNSLYTHMLNKSNPAGYSHLLSGPATRWFGWTGVAFVASQVVMLGALEWGSEAFRGMGWFERLAACLFQSVNSRHAGESVVDLAILSPAILVLFILMM
uniref:Uncharacterized protein n=1 Tax=Kalanchoe fedtschenkoi TaxID=63787 RepID=A0A7N0TC33_KALFE